MLLYAVLPALTGHALSERAQTVAVLITYLGISWWLIDDARRMKFTLPMSYGMLMLFFLPLFAPIYLFETRGLMAFVSIALYGISFICIVLIDLLIYVP